jgi:hypothetical protein
LSTNSDIKYYDINKAYMINQTTYYKTSDTNTLIHHTT